MTVTEDIYRVDVEGFGFFLMKVTVGNPFFSPNFVKLELMVPEPVGVKITRVTQEYNQT